MKRGGDELAEGECEKRSRRELTVKTVLAFVSTLQTADVLAVMKQAQLRLNILCAQIMEFLPDDVWRTILSFCDRRMTLVFGCTCKLLFGLANEYVVDRFYHMRYSSETFLRKFTALTHLELTSDITDRCLKDLTNIEALRLHQSDAAFPKAICSNFTNLRVLEMQNCRAILPPCILTNLTELSLPILGEGMGKVLSNLRTLRLSRSSQADLLEIIQLTNLTSLQLFYEKMGPILRNLTNLTDLRVDICKSVPGFDFSQELLNLRNLTSLDVSESVPVTTLAAMPLLTKLSLPLNYEEFPELLTTLTRLQSLSFFGWYPGDPHCLQHMNHLTCLRGAPHVNFPTTLRTLTMRKNMDILSLSHLTNLTVLKIADTIEDLEHLTNLVVFKQRSTIHPYFLPVLPNLTHLDFRSRKLEKFEITRQPKLTKLVALPKKSLALFDIVIEEACEVNDEESEREWSEDPEEW